jgi:predicted DNA-binding ribbon-helix-helix protein
MLVQPGVPAMTAPEAMPNKAGRLKFYAPASVRAHFDPTLRVVGFGGDRFNFRKVNERAGQGARTASAAVAICRLAESRAQSPGRSMRLPEFAWRGLETRGRAMNSPVVKRSTVIAGHKTSVSLEDAFWKGLKEIARGRGLTLSEMVTVIDSGRAQGNLSSALRLFVLDHYRAQIGMEAGTDLPASDMQTQVSA